MEIWADGDLFSKLIISAGSKIGLLVSDMNTRSMVVHPHNKESNT